MGHFAVDSCCWNSVSFQIRWCQMRFNSPKNWLSFLPFLWRSNQNFISMVFMLWNCNGQEAVIEICMNIVHACISTVGMHREIIYLEKSLILFFYLGTHIFRNSLDCGCDLSETWYMVSPFCLSKSLFDSSVDRLAWMKRKSSSHSSWISLFLIPGRSQSMW